MYHHFLYTGAAFISLPLALKHPQSATVHSKQLVQMVDYSSKYSCALLVVEASVIKIVAAVLKSV